MGKYDALFAKQCYIMVKSGSMEKRLAEINKNISHTRFKATGKSNRDVFYLANDKTREVHISHRGTDGSGKSKKFKTDIKQDLAFAFGRQAHNSATKKDVSRTNKLVKETPKDYKVIMSSHSLGNVAMSES
jgi:Txe/YoeB family toxin of Txe-Axe toxin-antitoxin module